MDTLSHITGRAELTAAIDELIEAIRHLTRGALRARSAEPSGAAADVERTLAGQLAAAWPAAAEETPVEAQQDTESSADVPPAVSHEPAVGGLPLEVRHSEYAENETAMVPGPNFDAIDPRPPVPRCRRADNDHVIAASIAALQDRLGGFIKN